MLFSCYFQDISHTPIAIHPALSTSFNSTLPSPYNYRLFYIAKIHSYQCSLFYQPYHSTHSQHTLLSQYESRMSTRVWFRNPRTFLGPLWSKENSQRLKKEKKSPLVHHRQSNCNPTVWNNNSGSMKIIPGYYRGFGPYSPVLRYIRIQGLTDTLTIE